MVEGLNDANGCSAAVVRSWLWRATPNQSYRLFGMHPITAFGPEHA